MQIITCTVNACYLLQNAEPLDAHKVHKLRAKRDTGDEIDPVYKKLSAINGEINRMTSKELRDKLAELKLDIRYVI